MSILKSDITPSIPIQYVPWTWYLNNGFSIVNLRHVPHMVNKYDRVLSKYRIMTVTPNGAAHVWVRSMRGVNIAPPLASARPKTLDELEQLIIKWTNEYGDIER